MTTESDDFLLRSVEGITALLCCLPPNLTGTEQLLVRGLVTRVLAASLHHWHGQGRARIQTLLLNRDVGFYDFTRSMLEVLNACTSERNPDGTATTQVLRIIASRYSDSRLTLSAIAQELQLSACHLSRLVTLRSGVGFLKHLHRTRVAAAAKLLVSTRLSVKEIAAAVGYGSTSALDRQFKRVHQMTPLDCRRSRLTAKNTYPSQSMTTFLS